MKQLLILDKIKRRITEKRRLKCALKRDMVPVDEWMEAMAEYLYFFEARCRIPSPWGFLDAPKPWKTMPQIRDIFLEEQYRCEFDVPPTRILDCGGNVGLSVLYFARNFENAVVEVFEANPDLAAVILRNCEKAGVSDRVVVSAKAVASETGTVRFTSIGDDRGHISPEGALVPCVDIAELVGEQLDLLKMDIEGGEFDCFDRLAETGQLGVPRRIVAEIHLENNDAERMARVVHQLKDVGFQVAIRGDLGAWTGPAVTRSPFHLVGANRMFMHLYAWK
jgi:FkbM family methyltransferase